MKACSRCGGEKDEAEFHSRRAACKECQRAATRAWKRANPDKVRAAKRRWKARWREANPEKAREHRHRTRARAFGVPWEPIDPARVFERDGGVCGVCHRPIARSPRGRGVWSLDHIVPLSRGGGHLYSNVQVAHLRCNDRKDAVPPPSKIPEA